MSKATELSMLEFDESAPFIPSHSHDTSADDLRIVVGGVDSTRQEREARTYRFLSLALLLISIPMIASCFRDATDHQCTRQMSTWSPMLDAVEYRWRRFLPSDGDLLGGQPTQDSEMRWDGLWEYGSIGIPRVGLPLLNKSVDDDWKHHAAELGGGIVGFIEGFHQIHCVHLLRQYSYRDRYNYSENPAFLRGIDSLYRHVDHCIQVLRINLMCRADVTPYLIEEYDDGGTAVRSDALYRCRSFERILEWTNENIVAPYNVTHERLAAKANAGGHDHHHASH